MAAYTKLVLSGHPRRGQKRVEVLVHSDEAARWARYYRQEGWLFVVDVEPTAAEIAAQEDRNASLFSRFED